MELIGMSRIGEQQQSTVVADSQRVTRPVWTARCKSGYLFARTVRVASVCVMGRTLSIDRQTERVCRRVCARGEILCSECAGAVTVAVESKTQARAWAIEAIAQGFAEVAR